MGEIGDEFDLPDVGILRIGRGRVRIGGSFPIEQFNHRFGTELSEEDYHTVGGFVFGELGRAPRVGDSVGFEGLRFEVAGVDGSRITEVDVDLTRADRPARRAGARTVRVGVLTVYRSSSLRRAMATSLAVIPPAEWLTQADLDRAPGDQQVGVVVGRLGRLAHAVGVGQRGGEVSELVAFAQRSVADFPAVQGCQRLAPVLTRLSTAMGRTVVLSGRGGMFRTLKDLNDTDLAIIAELQRDGRATFAHIAQQVGLSPAAVHERVKKLEARGVITGYRAVVDPEMVGSGVTAFILVTQTASPRDSLERRVRVDAVGRGVPPHRG